MCFIGLLHGLFIFNLVPDRPSMINPRKYLHVTVDLWKISMGLVFKGAEIICNFNAKTGEIYTSGLVDRTSSNCLRSFGGEYWSISAPNIAIGALTSVKGLLISIIKTWNKSWTNYSIPHWNPRWLGNWCVCYLEHRRTGTNPVLLLLFWKFHCLFFDWRHLTRLKAVNSIPYESYHPGSVQAVN